MSNDLVLVTGGSGFIATQCIVQLLSAGYRVRTTVRRRDLEHNVRTLLRDGGLGDVPPDQLEFVPCNLSNDAGWTEAADGCAYVLHMASPFPAKPPKHEDDLITPAREGSLRVLRAARDAKARRLVFTSSFAAIGFGHADQERPFTEADWTDLKRRPVSAYVKSKTLAERAVWDFYARERRELEVCVINPVEVFGPLLGSNYATTILLVKRALEGALPGLPKMWLSTVDVRDVADLHLRAMTHPLAVGERFIASAGPPISLVDVAHLLRRRLGEKAKRVPTRELPNFLIRLAALKEPGLKLMIPELGRRKELSNEKACRIFGWQPRSHEEALVATAESLWRLGLLEPK